MNPSRRSFIKYASLAAAGNLAGLSPFGSIAALAQTGSTYKALVCVFLYGGNDANNMLVPSATADYNNYAAIRGPLALAQRGLLPLNGQASLALNPNLRGLQASFNGGQSALLANVGTLTQPTTRDQYTSGAVTVPQNLFSHIDQQHLWHNADLVVNNSTGWAGRISDLMGQSTGGTLPMVFSVAGSQIFCSGNQTQSMTVTPNANSGVNCYMQPSDCVARLAAAQQLLAFDGGVKLIQADNSITSNTYGYSKTLADALASAPALATQFPGDSFAAQMKQIAKIISIHSSVGATRQIFFATLGDFDTHSMEVNTHNSLMARLDGGLTAFNQSMTELNLAQQVTSFTMSDFNRVMQPNTSYGSDHAWGSHHIITGGAVKGGKVYGTYPTLALGGPDDAGSTGCWIPSTSSSVYAATLASWFGVPASQLPVVLPALSGFGTQNVGFI